MNPDGTWGSYCTRCGTLLAPGDFPRICANGHITYLNALCVGVALQPIHLDDKTGLLAVERNIDPFKGEWALPGGFAENGETLNEAACRELFEETGIRQDASRVRFFRQDIVLPRHPHDPRCHLLHFSVMPVLDGIDPDVSNAETSRMDVLFPSPDGSALRDRLGNKATLCFPLHHQAALLFLSELKSS